MPSNSLPQLLTNVRRADGERVDVLISGDVIEAIEPCGTIAVEGAERHEGSGGLLLPGLVETHSHIDKTYSHEVYLDHGTSGRGALSDAIAAMGRYKEERSLDDMVQRARKAALRAAERGVCYLRSHIDLGSDKDLDVVRALIDLKREVSDQIALEFTALTSTATPGDRQRIREALQLGVLAIGGAPALEANPQGNIDHCLELAMELGCPVDLHVDENESPDSPCLEHLARRCLEQNVQVPVSAGHCCALGFMPEEQRKRQIGDAVDAGIAFITLPACNLVLMGREHWPRPRGIPPIAEMLDAGAGVCVGVDNVQDPFQPWGDYDPLQQAALLGHLAQWDGGASDTLVAMCTSAAAEAMGLQNYGLAAGCRADLTVLATNSEHGALCETPARTHRFFGGRRLGGVAS
ncbi:MAG: amidohydrolase family protein [Pseudomonadota bacterium]